MDSIRNYLAIVDISIPSWLTGIRDPLLAQALRQFHREPHLPWSVDKLASEAHLSPSRFAARFAAAFGDSSMTYIAKWRMNLARDLLRTTDLSTQEIAWRVGYQNVSAFTRAYKRHMDVSPAVWRIRQKKRPIIQS
jgi:AraC-like DNA-binding protein